MVTPELPRPALVLVTDSARLRDRALEDVVREAVLGGVSVVQLREKAMPHAALVALGARVRDAIAGRALFFVNGDVDAAVALVADGVHVPEDGPAIAGVRARVGGGVLISRAAHSVDAAVRAERDGADIVQLGTTFETASKPGRAAIGVEGVRAVCATVRVPVIAIGGITAANAGGVLCAGAAGVAVIGAIFDADDPRSAAAALRAAVASASVAAHVAPRGDGDPAVTAMHLTVNGKPRQVDAAPDGADGMTLVALLRAFDVNPRLVAVAINGDVIPKDEFAAATVREGDAVEIVRMVGGGAA